ncbi:FDLD family class I lanthipeptide [Tumebacillus flagellatus]|nr:FDLD family class I lanthipeptide [Tumebacillus flagellatus]
MEQMFDLDVQVQKNQPTTSVMPDSSTSFGSGSCFCTIAGCDYRNTAM